jgi:hypothetical protein
VVERLRGAGFEVEPFLNTHNRYMVSWEWSQLAFGRLPGRRKFWKNFCKNCWQIKFSLL